MRDNADHGKPVGDALRTTSIEAATRAIAEAIGPMLVADDEFDARIDCPALGAVACDAVLGVAMPSIQRDALGEAIAAVEAMRTIDRPRPGGGAPYRSIDRCAMLERLRGLRDTQAPT